MIQRHLTWPLPYALNVCSPWQKNLRALCSCLPPEGCDQHEHLCGYKVRKPCGRAEQVGLIFRILCWVLSSACCSASSAWCHAMHPKTGTPGQPRCPAILHLPHQCYVLSARAGASRIVSLLSQLTHFSSQWSAILTFYEHPTTISITAMNKCYSWSGTKGKWDNSPLVNCLLIIDTN